MVMFPDWTIAHGDALFVLSHLPSKIVQAVCTSPPYYGLRAYEGVEAVDWPAVTYAPMAGLPEITVPPWRGNLGHEPTPEMYIGHLVAVFREVRRVLRDDGVCWLNLGDSYASSTGGRPQGQTGQRASRTFTAGPQQAMVRDSLPDKNLMMIPARAALALQADGWWLRSDVIWAKSNPMPESVTDRPTKAHEYIFLLSKSERYFYDADSIREPNAEHGATDDGFVTNWKMRPNNGARSAKGLGGYRMGSVTSGRNKRTVWEISTKPFPQSHFAVFPDGLPDVCLRAGASERGCCPACAAPWERVVEREASRVNKREGKRQQIRHGGALSGGTEHVTLGVTEHVRRETVGWRPTCACGDHEPVPCLTLDPFCGAGTTGLVALRQGHRFIGIEPSAKYARMAEQRIIDDAPMLTRPGLVAA